MSWLDDVAGHVFTASGVQASQDTVTYKFSPGALQFSGSGTYNVSTPDSADFNLGGNNSFCIDFQLYPLGFPSGDGHSNFCGHAPSGFSNPNLAEWRFFMYSSLQYLGWKCFGDNGAAIHSVQTDAEAGLSTSNWYHIAMCANQNISDLDFRFFVDGTQLGTTQTVATASIVDPKGSFRIGYSFSYPNLYCKIDEFRFSIGTPRWTSNFTKPAAPHALDGYTKVLLHFGEATILDTFCTVVSSIVNS